MAQETAPPLSETVKLSFTFGPLAWVMLDPDKAPILWAVDFMDRMRRLPKRKRAKAIKRMDKELRRILKGRDVSPIRDVAGQQLALDHIAKSYAWWQYVCARLAQE